MPVYMKKTMWNEIEKRGREKLNLNNSWHLYFADLDSSNNYGYAIIKFAQKTKDKFITEKAVSGEIEYLDLQ